MPPRFVRRRSRREWGSSPVADAVRSSRQRDGRLIVGGARAAQLQGTVLYTRRQDIYTIMRPHYETIADSIELYTTAHGLLSELAGNVKEFSMTYNFDLTTGFLDLILTCMSVRELLSRFADRRQVICVYTNAYALVNGTGEPRFPRLANWLENSELPLQPLQDDFRSINQAVAAALLALTDPLASHVLPAEELRKMPNLNALAGAANIVDPSMCTRSDLLGAERIARWLIAGYLACPEHLAKNEHFDLLRSAVSLGAYVRLIRDEVIDVQTHIDRAMSLYRGEAKLHKRKQQLLDTLSNVWFTAGEYHAARRRFVRQALYQLECLLIDKPGLLGPKLPLLLRLMVIALDEVAWYFRHYECLPQKQRGKVNEVDYADPAVVELIYFLFALRQCATEHRGMIRQYFTAFLAGSDLESLQQCPQVLLVASEDRLLQSFSTTLASLGGHQQETHDFTGLRLDWLRLQCALSLKQAPVLLFKLPHLCDTMHQVVLHTLYVDSLDDVLKEVRARCRVPGTPIADPFAIPRLQCASTGFLWFHRKPFADHFERALQMLSLCRYAPSFVPICHTFLEVIHRCLPEEVRSLGYHMLPPPSVRRPAASCAMPAAAGVSCTPGAAHVHSCRMWVMSQPRWPRTSPAFW